MKNLIIFAMVFVALSSFGAVQYTYTGNELTGHDFGRNKNVTEVQINFQQSGYLVVDKIGALNYSSWDGFWYTTNGPVNFNYQVNGSTATLAINDLNLKRPVRINQMFNAGDSVKFWVSTESDFGSPVDQVRSDVQLRHAGTIVYDNKEFERNVIKVFAGDSILKGSNVKMAYLDVSIVRGQPLPGNLATLLIGVCVLGGGWMIQKRRLARA